MYLFVRHIALLFLTLISISGEGQYCIPNIRGSCFSAHINTVKMPGVFNELTGCNSTPNRYFFFTEDTVQAFQGSSFNFEVEIFTSSSFTSSGIGIWIDFNQDEDFEDEGEFVFTSPVLVSSDTIKSRINIPTDALTGNTRLRIILLRNGFVLENNSCGFEGFKSGEAEDYPIFIQPQPENDVAVSELLSTRVGCDLSSTEPLTVRVKNHGTSNQTNIPISYQLNNEPTVTEMINQTIKTNDSLNYTFTSTLDLSEFGTFNLSVWTDLNNDPNRFNDSLVNIEIINQCFCIPDDPINCSLGDYVDRVQISNIDNTPGGTGCSGNPNGYTLFTQDTILMVRGAVTKIIMTPNRNRLTSFGIWLDRNQDNDFDDDQEFQFSSPLAITPVIEDFQFNETDPIGITRMRVRANFNIDLVNPCETSTFGETEDYIVNVLPAIENDLAMRAFLNRVPSPVCKNGEETLGISFANDGLKDQTGFQISARVNGGTPITETFEGIAGANSVRTYTFNHKFDFSEPGDYLIDFWTTLDGDSYNFNDTLKNILIQNIPPDVTPLPLNEDFEEDRFPPKNWTVINEDNQEEWDQFITDEGANKSAFVRSLAFISISQIIEKLYTPPLNLSSFSNPKARFRVAYALRQLGIQELRVLVSGDCGFNFLDTIYSKVGTELATAIPTRDEWSPEDFSEWREESASLINFAGNSDVVVNFEAANDFGNNFYLDDIEIIDAPINDDCENAICIPLDSTIEFMGDTKFATQIMPAIECDGRKSFLARDLWYKVEADTNNLFIGVIPNGDFDPVIEVYEGGCGVDLFACSDTTGPGELEVILLSDLIPDTTYFIRVYPFGDFPPENTTFSIIQQRQGITENDDCDEAFSLDVNENCQFITAVANGTESFPTGCSGNADGDIWFSFTATKPELFINVIALLDFDGVIELWDDCDGELLFCQDETFKGEDEILRASGLTVGDTFFIRVYDHNTPTVLTAAFRICVSEQELVGVFNNQSKETKVKLYPNPTNSEFIIEIVNDKLTNLSFKLMNSAGKTILNELVKGTYNNYQKRIDLSGYLDGIYFLQILLDNQVYTKKITLIK